MLIYIALLAHDVWRDTRAVGNAATLRRIVVVVTFVLLVFALLITLWMTIGVVIWAQGAM